MNSYLSQGSLSCEIRVPEQVRDEDVSVKKEKKRANVVTTRKTKPIVASVPQYCSNRKIGFLEIQTCCQQ